jgi:hypothetical protein
MSPVKPFLKQNAGTILLIGTLFVSLGLNVYQGLKLKGALDPVSGVRAGARFPISLPVLDAAGKPAVLNFAEDSRPTVVYVLSPLCGWCKRNEANIKTLMADAGARFRFIGLSVEGKSLKEYAAENRAPFPVYLVSSQDQVKSLHLDGTPQTVVIDATGKVEKAWQGAYLEGNKKEIEKFFGVKLPGLQEISAVSDVNSKAANSAR